MYLRVWVKSNARHKGIVNNRYVYDADYNLASETSANGEVT